MERSKYRSRWVTRYENSIEEEGIEEEEVKAEARRRRGEGGGESTDGEDGGENGGRGGGEEKHAQNDSFFESFGFYLKTSEYYFEFYSRKYFDIFIKLKTDHSKNE
ncbi:hypothetical protein Droror1_Dr00014756 [Drosera rotundifolia]